MKYGAEVIRRLKHLSTDESSADDLLIHAMDVLRCAEEYILVFLKTTSPLLQLSYLDACIGELLQDSALGSGITVRESHPFMRESENGYIWNLDSHTRKLRPMRQELGLGGCEAGGYYAIRVINLRK